MATDGHARMIYGLAVRLGKFPSEINDRPLEEIYGLVAFLKWQDAQDAAG